MKYTTWSVQRLNDKKGKPWQAIAQYKEDGKWRHKTRLFRQAQGKKEAEKLAEEWFDELNEAAKERPDVDETLKTVDFDVFAIGGDQNHAGFRRAVKWCEENGKQVVRLPRTPGICSSEIKEQLNGLK